VVDAPVVHSPATLGAVAPAPAQPVGSGVGNKSRPGTVSSVNDERLGHLGHHSLDARRSVSLAIDWNLRLLHLHGRPLSDSVTEVCICGAFVIMVE
jgi:hypothetical protein